MNLSHIQAMRHEAQQPQKATFPALSATNGQKTLDDALKADIAALRRSGALDTPGTERIAVGTLAYLYRLSDRQAWQVWTSYAASVAPL